MMERDTNKALFQIKQEQIQQAKEVDPTHIFEKYGFDVKRDGGQNHLKAVNANGKEHYRSSCKDGKWVHLKQNGPGKENEVGIGDNIALMQFVAGLGFKAAISELIKVSANPALIAAGAVRNQYAKHKKIDIWENNAAKTKNREYLNLLRKIDESTIKHAEKVGFIKHITSGPVFVGYDDKDNIRSGYLRIVCVERDKNGVVKVDDKGNPLTKRDLTNTDKTYPPILPGSDEEVWIVEGGVDALAVQTLYNKKGLTPPTVIVSGGSKTKKFLQNEKIVDLLKNTTNIFVAFENEKDANIQKDTDDDKEQKIKLIKKITEKNVYRWKPPSKKYKDVADLCQKTT
ncbi:MAG: hypothetical protein ACOCQQ_01735 [Candidatus Nanoarchaeia archaeon]